MLFSPTIAIAAGFVHRRNSSGSSAIFAAIRRVSSRVSNLAAIVALRFITCERNERRWIAESKNQPGAAYCRPFCTQRAGLAPRHQPVTKTKSLESGIGSRWKSSSVKGCIYEGCLGRA
jgi:hypothetical protein